MRHLGDGFATPGGYRLPAGWSATRTPGVLAGCTAGDRGLTPCFQFCFLAQWPTYVCCHACRMLCRTYLRVRVPRGPLHIISALGLHDAGLTTLLGATAAPPTRAGAWIPSPRRLKPRAKAGTQSPAPWAPRPPRHEPVSSPTQHVAGVCSRCPKVNTDNLHQPLKVKAWGEPPFPRRTWSLRTHGTCNANVSPIVQNVQVDGPCGALGLLGSRDCRIRERSPPGELASLSHPHVAADNEATEKGNRPHNNADDKEEHRSPNHFTISIPYNKARSTLGKGARRLWHSDDACSAHPRQGHQHRQGDNGSRLMASSCAPRRRGRRPARGSKRQQRFPQHWRILRKAVCRHEIWA